VYASWLEDYSPADQGRSFFAPADVIAGATSAQNSMTALVVLTVDDGSLHSTPTPWRFTVPAGHYITAIERVVDKFVIMPIDDFRYSLLFTQRVRIWTEPIPEPSAGMLALLAIGTKIVIRFY
jgi:hypothetical protein